MYVKITEYIFMDILNFKMVGEEGFEPSNDGSKARRLWPLGDTPAYCIYT